MEQSVAKTADFLPLRVDYAEKLSATGRTSGSYIKREGRPSEREILISRLIDRSLRPMFVDGFFNEVQVLANVYSYDGIHQADALAITCASAALHLSQAKLEAPVAGVRMGWKDGWIVEPNLGECDSEIVVAGCERGILMIEGWCDFLEEQVLVEGVSIAWEAIKKMCAGIRELSKLYGGKEKVGELRVVPSELRERVQSLGKDIDDALAVIGKKDRDKRVNEVKDKVFAEMAPTREDELNDPDGSAEREVLLKMAWKDYVTQRMRKRILEEDIRPDGRDSRTVRPITIDQGPLPGTHGSSLFTRGETQTLAVATLGGDDMAQRFETLEGEDASRFYLQYSFPPFSVGEVGRIGPPGRREIGHGKLAERALVAAIPSKDEFPYVIRVESNIMESNGSSSMASVCGGHLALLEAGVPMKCSVAGVAMGLIIDEAWAADLDFMDEKAVVLTDILGLEDALGCCDAKFAGSRNGISAVQLDVKLKGISVNLFSRILNQAKEGRSKILDCMEEAMPTHRETLPNSVPKLKFIQIPPKRIGDVIGAGGKTISSIIQKCGGENVMRISIENDGKVCFTSADDEMLKKAQDMVKAMVNPIEVGTILKGTVKKILPFGAYVEVAIGKEGWLHISELEQKRTSKVTDVCNVGDVLEVKVIEASKSGQLRLSRRAILSNSKAPENGKIDNTKEQTSKSSSNGAVAKEGTGAEHQPTGIDAPTAGAAPNSTPVKPNGG